MARLLVSVAICTYNGSAHLKEQLNSILNQSIKPDEIVVCDDGSSDDTIQILRGYEQTYNCFVIVENKQNLGFGRNFEQAIKLCTGDIIFLSDQDDVWMPNKIEVLSSYLEEYPQILGVFSNGYQMDEMGAVLNDSIWQATFSDENFPIQLGKEALFPWLSINNNCIIGASVAFRRNAIAGIFNSWLPDEPWHDYLIVLKLSLTSALAPLPNLLMKYRQHQSQTVGLKGHYERAEQINFARKAWTGTSLLSEHETVSTYFAFGLSNMERYKAQLAVTSLENDYYQRHYIFITKKLKQSMKKWLRTMPLISRKIKLLKHWLKGGEYLRVNFYDLIFI